MYSTAKIDDNKINLLMDRCSYLRLDNYSANKIIKECNEIGHSVSELEDDYNEHDNNYYNEFEISNRDNNMIFVVIYYPHLGLIIISREDDPDLEISISF
jgi:hypothetical protein